MSLTNTVFAVQQHQQIALIFYILIFAIQKTMLGKEPDIQFRDSIFHNRSSLAKQARNSYINASHVKISRSTWSKKVKRYQNGEVNGGLGNLSFENPFVQNSPIKVKEQFHGTQTKNASDCDMNGNKKQFHDQQKVGKKEKLSKIYITSHFIPNRNICNQNLHEDQSQSGILIEKLENEHDTMFMPNNKSKDSRLFLKSIKLKNNFNLFKGNFSKFAKKDIIHPIKTKRFNINTEIQTSRFQSERSRMFV